MNIRRDVMNKQYYIKKAMLKKAKTKDVKEAIAKVYHMKLSIMQIRNTLGYSGPGSLLQTNVGGINISQEDSNEHIKIALRNLDNAALLIDEAYKHLLES
jgi:hypothetical protein